MFIYDNNGIIPYDSKRTWGCVSSLRQNYEPEILAPSSIESYKCAINNGADAIYFGYKELNARAKGDNFESLKEITDYCHSYGVKAYLALNIAIKDNELDYAKKIIIEADQALIDAFIISDLSLIPIINKYSKAHIHASTQMGIHNLSGAKFLEKRGFDRVVLSRETTFKEIADIKNQCKIEVEVFVHGALCVGFSGACLLSSIITGNSGNRGRCNQLCRQYYTCELDGKKINEGYLLSAKDVCMIDKLKILKELKVDSFKIEGRLRRQEYIGGVTEIYNFYAKNDLKVSQEDKNILKKLFNRGNFISLYSEEKDKIYPYLPSHMGLICGKVDKVISENKAIVKTEFLLLKNDGLKIIRNKIEITGGVVTEKFNGINKYYIYTEKCVKQGDLVYITTDNNLNNAIKNNVKKVKAEIGIRFVAGEKAHIIASLLGKNIEIYDAEIIEEAVIHALTKEEIREQFSKTGGTNIVFDFVNIYTENAFANKSKLNSVRRKVINILSKLIIENYTIANKISIKPIKRVVKERIQGDFCEIKDYESISEILKKHIKNFVYCPDVFNYDDCLNFYKKSKNMDNLIFIKPPILILDKSLDLLTEICGIFDGIVANNYGLIEIAENLNKYIIACYNLNITNSKNPLIKECNQYIASVELNRKELDKFKGALLYTYGNLPLMHLTHCPRKDSNLKCGNCDGDLIYKDQKGKYLITTQKFNNNCLHTLRNGIVTNLGDVEGFNKYFDFTTISKTEIDEIINCYYVTKNFHLENYNHLHLTRGVQ